MHVLYCTACLGWDDLCPLQIIDILDILKPASLEGMKDVYPIAAWMHVCVFVCVCVWGGGGGGDACVYLD